jgi:hypothetical protein
MWPDGRVSRSVAAVLSRAYHSRACLLLPHRRESRAERRRGIASLRSIVVPLSLSLSFILPMSPVVWQILRIGILNAVKTLPETSRVGLITFASAISVYELGLPEVASAEVFPGMLLFCPAPFLEDRTFIPCVCRRGFPVQQRFCVAGGTPGELCGQPGHSHSDDRSHPHGSRRVRSSKAAPHPDQSTRNRS